MSESPAFTPEESRRFVDTCRRFEDALRKGQQPSIDIEAAAWSGPQRTYVQKELVALTVRHRSASGVRSVAQSHLKPQQDEFTTFDPNAAPRAAGPAEQPDRIGRYRVVQVLGEGSFGRVYLAHDDDLHRAVAIKVPLPRRVARPEDAEAFLSEARTLASLSHPHIVSVFDVGRTDKGLCFVVSKFIEGTDLVRLLKKSWPGFAESARIVATVAEALHHAHRAGLVHRDVKPANILIDAAGVPILADFGLALKDADFGKGNGFAGTPAYMSPEQANGEGHRVDGRSDIFSLGVVFYELLTRKRPFKTDTQPLANVDAKPLRQVDDAIPKELERICLKALAKKASDRYTVAKDMADDLTAFLADHSAAAPSVGMRSTSSHRPPSAPDLGPPTAPPSVSSATATSASLSSVRQLKIVPKGLRSFDVHDANFFLELLPGPRDRDGLPDSIRFWKSRIEDDETFAVGLIYGPSGCGKSSLVKAGLLPRLSAAIDAVYIEATAEETEARLLAGIRKRCPDLGEELTLKGALEAIRRGHGLPTENKLLVVIDQFEQWLHAKKDAESADLVQALRQCDGDRLQAIVLVRDDFWMAATRFMRELEVRLVDGDNAAAVDLFPIRHAEKVLASFGRAFGCLPEKQSDQTREQTKFIEQAVAGLVQEGKVIPVRLALFAEMMKGKTWTSAELKAVGGTEGVGVTFLEETFSARSAPADHRAHQKAARAVLKALLPGSGTDIKGHMRSRAQLLQASGYSARPKDFDDLLRILDGKIRLLTPTDPGGAEEPATRKEKKSAAAARSYQLTHDYLVPSIRDWLARKQKETPRGRAELLLADRASVWIARPESRQLPSLGQWLGIRRRTSAAEWTAPERKMMRAAARHHGLRAAALAICLAIASGAGFAFWSHAAEQRNATHAASLVQQLDTADITHVPNVVAELADYRRWADPLLQQSFAKAESDSHEKLHASLALLPVDPDQANFLCDRLLDADPHEVAVLIDALAPHKDALVEKLWQAATTIVRGKDSRRLRAASALAAFDPHGDRWATIKSAVVDDLVTVPIVHLGLWTKPLRPVRKTLLIPLSVVFSDPNRREIERSLATDILADFAADEPRTLADLLLDSDSRQFAYLFPLFRKHGEAGLPKVIAEIDRRWGIGTQNEGNEVLAKRRANAAIVLLLMDRPEKAWSVLHNGFDPRARSYMIHRLGPYGADPRALLERLEQEPDVSVRRALILSLGEFSDNEYPSADRKSAIISMQGLYRTDPDPGVHAAAEWLLRTWKQEAWLKRTDQQLAQPDSAKNPRLGDLRRTGKGTAWYVNGKGHTMVAIAGPVDFRMGSPKSEPGRAVTESLRMVRIERTFALASKPVTMEQYREFDRAYQMEPKFHRSADLPVVGTSWFEAAAYCNWLSEQEGIDPSQWCYEKDAAGKITRLKRDSLSLLGYRLPTEAEMEYATRAGALTSRPYGDTEELLPKYAWYAKNSQDKTWPVGSLKPNDLGLFDSLGNAFGWCQGSFGEYPESAALVTDESDTNLKVVDSKFRSLRGGSFKNQPANVRSASRFGYGPEYRYMDFGFRPARTLKGS